MSRKRTDDPAALAELGRVLIALGDQTRQDILVALSGERLNVGQLAERFPLSRPAVSHQLKVLADAGLLVRDRHGRERVYRLDPACCRALVDRLGKFVAHCCANAKCCRDQGGGQP